MENKSDSVGPLKRLANYQPNQTKEKEDPNFKIQRSKQIEKTAMRFRERGN